MAWVQRREDGEPLAWITGSTTFCGRRYGVVPGVYVPRLQTEALARRAADVLPEGGRALDLCCGSGVIAAHLHATVPSAFVVGADVDAAAVRCARRNGVVAVRSDLADAIRGVRSFDVITAVAPYVPAGELRFLPRDVQRFEPRRALDGGADGLDVVRRVVDAARRLLAPGGHLLLELGGDETEGVVACLAAAGLDVGEVWADDDGQPRGCHARHGGPI